MKQFAILLPVAVCLLLAFQTQAAAQNRDRTIEDSWDRARTQPKEEAAPLRTPPAETPLAPQNVHPTPGGDFPTWDKKSIGTKPWPGAPRAGRAHNLREENTMLIDSLAGLYCLSSSYIAGLRQRNDVTQPSPVTPAGKDFQYKKEAPVPAATGQESADALHRELLLLLERCLNSKQ
jgi:hypothetical protein